MLSLFSAQQSLVVGARAPVRSSAVSMAGTIPEELAKLQGPEIFWGSEGVELGYEESDIKGYDNSAASARRSTMGLKDASRAASSRCVAPSDSARARSSRAERRHAGG